MAEIMEVNYSNEKSRGKMTVRLDGFFPCPLAKFKKFLNIVEMENNFNEFLNHYRQIRDFFRAQISKNKEDIKHHAKAYFDGKQEYAEASAYVESGKTPSGLPISKDDIKDYKKLMKRLKSEIRYSEREIKRNEKAVKMNTECLEYFEIRYKDWEE